MRLPSVVTAGWLAVILCCFVLVASAADEECSGSPNSTPFSMVNLIERKRDGRELTTAEINAMVQKFTSGEVPEYQITAMLMAIYFRGMTEAETAALTIAFTNSGDRMDLSSLGIPAADKHSTGGVGDKVSLVLAPLASSCGLAVPMMSGRSLGHTGSTFLSSSIRSFGDRY